jgi:hypothetical protein
VVGLGRSYGLNWLYWLWELLCSRWQAKPFFISLNQPYQALVSLALLLLVGVIGPMLHGHVFVDILLFVKHLQAGEAKVLFAQEALDVVAAGVLLHYPIAVRTMFGTFFLHPFLKLFVVSCYALLVIFAAFTEVVLGFAIVAGSREATRANVGFAVVCGEVRGAIWARAFDVGCWILSKVCLDCFR